MTYPKFVIERSDNNNNSNKFYFNLYSERSQIIATSNMFESIASCKNGIDSVKESVLKAVIDDQS